MAVLVAAIATLSFCAALASAQIPVNGTAPSVATPVFNIDDPGRIPYQAEVVVDNCSFLDVCGFIFSAVPAGHRLVIQHVSANINVNDVLDDSTKVIVYFASLNHPVSAFTAHPFIGGNILTGTFDQPVEVFVDAGDAPRLIVNLPVSSFLPENQAASIFGYLVDCTKAPCEAIAGDRADAHFKFPVRLKK
jgi:hypothetical protein